MTEQTRTDALHTIEQVRNRIAVFLVGSFVSTIPLFVFKTIPADNKEIIVYMVGQLSGMALMALGFYFSNKIGQDALDAKRSETTGKLAEAVVAVAATTPPTQDAAQGAQAAADAASDVADELKKDRTE